MSKPNFSRIPEHLTLPCLKSAPYGAKLTLPPEAMTVCADGSGWLDPYATPVPEREGLTGNIVVEKRKVERTPPSKGWGLSYVVDLSNLTDQVWPPSPSVPKTDGVEWYQVGEFIPARAPEPEEASA